MGADAEWLLDTDVLVYAADRKSPFHDAAVELRQRALDGKTRGCVCPQVLYEFYAVVKILDCILVATMIANGVVGIYTGDVDHFMPYKEIKVENPFE